MKRSVLYFITILISCNYPKPDINKTANDFADIELRAMSLQDKRFSLADTIRFTQDTLLHTSNKADTFRLKIRLEELNKEKDVILQKSLVLADSIHKRLDSLMENELADKKNKAMFDQLLTSALTKHAREKDKKIHAPRF